MPAGRLATFNAGFGLADRVADGVVVQVLYAPSARTRETAAELARGLGGGLLTQNKSRARVAPPRAESAIRNFQFIVDGHPVPPTDRMHASLPASAEHNPYLQAFWRAMKDPIGYWLAHPSASAETPAAVAARLRAFFVSLLAAKSEGLYVLVTHSGPMRAFLREALGADPGEPDFCEMFRVTADGVHYRGQRVAFRLVGV
ncbi:MAG: histidine phosphatase family protein [Chloroflexota bacterium]|nr:histidine phosphatase family protein [Chloroflexota bacterium]